MGVKRYELSEMQWARIAHLLPGKVGDPGRTGGNRGRMAGIGGAADRLVE